MMSTGGGVEGGMRRLVVLRKQNKTIAGTHLPPKLLQFVDVRRRQWEVIQTLQKYVLECRFRFPLQSFPQGFSFGHGLTDSLFSGL